jgi:hypothetical protein
MVTATMQNAARNCREKYARDRRIPGADWQHFLREFLVAVLMDFRGKEFCRKFRGGERNSEFNRKKRIK